MQTSIPKSPPARLAAEDRPNERASANFPHFVAQLEIFHSPPLLLLLLLMGGPVHYSHTIS